jgi:intergrase/recombinase
MSIIAQYKGAPEFNKIAASTRRDYLRYIKLIEEEFGDLPIAALADRRVRGDFKNWRDKYANTPRKADLAWTVLARIISFAKDRGIITTNPCERGGRLYVADRRDKIWSEQDIAAVLAVASNEIKLALILALWSGQRLTRARISGSVNRREADASLCLQAVHCGRCSALRSVVDR